MGSQDIDGRLQELFDKEEIRDRLARYCRGVDRSDAEEISQAFHADAMADHGHVFFTGDDIGEVLVSMFDPGNATNVHFIGNVIVEIDGDEAYSEAYLLDTVERERDGTTYLLTRSARFVDRWERRDGRWGIVYRQVVDSWNRVDPVSERWPGADRFLLAERGRGDAAYAIRTAERTRPPGATEGREFVERMKAAGFSTGERR